MFRQTKIALLAVTLAATAVATYAAKTMENDGAALAPTKISLTQAVSAAEQHAGRRAVRAELEHTAAGLAYDVEVVSGAKVFDVRIDPNQGTVISSLADQADQDDHQDKQD